MSRCGDVAIRNYPRWRSVFVLENQLRVYCSGIFFNIRLLQTRSLQGSIRTIIRTRHHPNMHKLSCWLLSLYGTAEGYEMKAKSVGGRCEAARGQLLFIGNIAVRQARRQACCDAVSVRVTACCYTLSSDVTCVHATVTF